MKKLRILEKKLMRMEGVKELEAIKAAMENQDSKLSNSPNINAS
jgi:hypothetical protein